MAYSLNIVNEVEHPFPRKIIALGCFENRSFNRFVLFFERKKADIPIRMGCFKFFGPMMKEIGLAKAKTALNNLDPMGS